MRYLQKFILVDLQKKMVFISGPRQSGKTTLVKNLIADKSSLYLNWDDVDERKKILARAWTNEMEYIALDEIHKYSRWKNFVKGTYDTQKEKHKFVITGSAKLNTFKKGQDSMVGRFFSWRLHPLCLSELNHHFKYDNKNAIHELLKYGGFPEPFFSKDIVFSKRWRKERINLVFRQDIKEIENIKDINLLEMFYASLTERVTGEVVLSNIARDLEISPKTAKQWLEVLEKTYALFIVLPYSKSLARAVVKTPKVYFYDNGEVQGDLGAQLENLVANHLYKKIQFLEDSAGDRYELNYVRDRNTKHEIDFVILKNRKPEIIVEVKVSDLVRSKSLYYFKEKLKVKKAVQLVMEEVETSVKDGIVVANVADWLSRKLEEEF